MIRPVRSVHYQDDVVTKAEIHCHQCNSPFDLRWTGEVWVCRVGCSPFLDFVEQLTGRTMGARA